MIRAEQKISKFNRLILIWTSHSDFFFSFSIEVWTVSDLFEIIWNLLRIQVVYTCNQHFQVHTPVCGPSSSQSHKPEIITPNWKAIDQREEEVTMAACDDWPSDSPNNQRLPWPWSLQTWKVWPDQCTRHGQGKHHRSAFQLQHKWDTVTLKTVWTFR